MSKDIVCYLPLEKFHIVPIYNLTPDSLKLSAKNTICDREKIKHNSKLNAIVKSLGFKGGFSDYEHTHYPNLSSFLKENNLITYKDLFQHQNTGAYHLLKPFSAQSISEKIFFDSNQLPQRIFTGHNFNFNQVYDWHNQDINDVCDIFKDNPLIHKCLNTYLSPININERFTLIEDNAFYILNFKFLGENVTCYLIDLALLLFRSYLCDGCYTILGDNLVENATNEKNYIFTNYFMKDVDVNYRISQIKIFERVNKLMIQRFSMGEKGWVNLIPFNKNLVFLTDNKGNYSFVIKNQRDDTFEHQILGKYLKRADIPNCIEDYRFKRWFYFEHQGYKKLATHEAEQYYYKTNNVPKSYPGQCKVLTQYFIETHQYTPNKRKYNLKKEGFNRVDLTGKSLMISNLITIDELFDFVKNNQEYLRYRQGDNLNTVNQDSPRSLPASLSYYDVLAYINWREEHDGINYRLLSTEEYYQIRDQDYSQIQHKKISDQEWNKLKQNNVNKFIFKSPNGQKYEEHPPYMGEDTFQLLLLLFPDNLSFLICNKLNFVNSNYFCEWLLDGIRIRSKNLTSFYDDYAMKDTGPRESTGKYKGVKTGFRLCYEYEVNNHKELR